jgi:putative MATE family efflux protein
VTHSPPPRPRLFSIGWPLFVELLLGIGVGLVGTALAARVSDATGAAFSLTNQIAATLFVVFRIIGAGIGVVLTQRLGAAQHEAAGRVARASLGASTWIGGATALVAWLGATPLMRLMSAPPEVEPLAVPFLMMLAPALLADAWNAAMASVMRAHLRTRDTLAVIVAMHASHLLLVIPLMGRLGLPGYALALLASRALGVGLHLWLWRLRLGLVPRWADWWQAPRAELAAMLRIGLPGAAENIAYRLGYMVSVAVVAQQGAQALATQAYTSQLMYGVLLFGLATGLTVEILVGHLIGAGLLHDAHRLVKRALARGLLASVLIAAVAALATPWLLKAFTPDPKIIAAGTVLMWITVLLEPGRTFNLVLVNALRAAGDARYPVAAGAASMALVLAGGSWLLGTKLGWGLPGVWLAYVADEWIRGLLMWRRWATLGWVPHARRARAHHR